MGSCEIGEFPNHSSVLRGCHGRYGNCNACSHVLFLSLFAHAQQQPKTKRQRGKRDRALLAPEGRVLESAALSESEQATINSLRNADASAPIGAISGEEHAMVMESRRNAPSDDESSSVAAVVAPSSSAAPPVDPLVLDLVSPVASSVAQIAPAAAPVAEIAPAAAPIASPVAQALARKGGAAPPDRAVIDVDEEPDADEEPEDEELESDDDDERAALMPKKRSRAQRNETRWGLLASFPKRPEAEIQAAMCQSLYGHDGSPCQMASVDGHVHCRLHAALKESISQIAGRCCFIDKNTLKLTCKEHALLGVPGQMCGPHFRARFMKGKSARELEQLQICVAVSITKARELELKIKHLRQVEVFQAHGITAQSINDAPWVSAEEIYRPVVRKTGLDF